MPECLLGPDDLVLSAVPAAHVPLLDRLGPARAAGFRGICLGVRDIEGLLDAGWGASAIAGRIADQGLAIADVECIGIWLACHQTDRSPYARAMQGMTPGHVVELAAALGARGVLVMDMLAAHAPPEDAAMRFAAICDLAAPAGITVHLESVPFGGIPTIARAREIIELAGRANGALTIDSWHLFRGAGTLDEVAQLPPGLIGCVQLSDAPTRPLADPLEETTRARLSPGMGQLDIVGLIRALDAAGSLAPIAVEVFNKANRTQPFTELASGWASAARAVLDRARSVRSDPKLAMAIRTA